MTRKPGRDFAADITSLILEKLEQGVLPWKRPWNARATRPLRHNGEPYSGINHFYLGLVADTRNYKSPFWMTYRQSAELGGQVRKGEQGAYSVYYARATARETDLRSGDDRARSFAFLKYYHVFNCDQIDNLPAHFHPEPATPQDIAALRGDAQAFLDGIPVPVLERGDEAFYSPLTDTITLPPRELFHSADARFSTLAHEAAHSTGAAHRLNRKFGKRFGDQAYAAEELCACMAEAKLCAEFEMDLELHDNHAAYLGHWVSILKSDKTAIIHAAAKADQAIKWLKDNARRPVAEAA
jgi:antirestriction protein ArdC